MGKMLCQCGICYVWFNSIRYSTDCGKQDDKHQAARGQL